VSKPVIERAAEIPLAWMRIEVPGGSSVDPVGVEGLTRHAALLARHGAGERDRAAFDDAVDGLGATLSVSTGRDSVAITSIGLSRNLERLVELCATMLERPRMEAAEHDKLRRETRASIHELRDDDGQLAARFFARFVATGHPYGRTAAGTLESLERIELDAAIASQRQRTSAANLLVGFAGDIDEARAEKLTNRLLDAAPDGEVPPVADVATAPRLDGRRLYIIDKPDRAQCQVAMGHTIPAYSSPHFDALTVVETAFGGTFTSRLMQEVRAKRGWSYDAGCDLGRTRGPHWLRMHMTPTVEHLGPALSLVAGMYEELAAHGITAEELDFCRSYLRGSVAFNLATAQQRLRTRLRNRVVGVPEDHVARFGDRLEALTGDDIEAALGLLRPADLVTVVVASADDVLDQLSGLGLGEPQVIPHDSY
jgi:zinc protease